jgi:hypothetical protein
MAVNSDSLKRESKGSREGEREIKARSMGVRMERKEGGKERGKEGKRERGRELSLTERSRGQREC